MSENVYVVHKYYRDNAYESPEGPEITTVHKTLKGAIYAMMREIRYDIQEFIDNGWVDRSSLLKKHWHEIYNLWKPENWKTLDTRNPSRYRGDDGGISLTTDRNGCLDIEFQGGEGEERRQFIRMFAVDSDMDIVEPDDLYVLEHETEDEEDSDDED